MSGSTSFDVLIVGGGVAGMTAGVFLARAGLDTTIIDSNESLLRRNGHLENFPGFPHGVNPRLLLEMMRDQAERAGCTVYDGEVNDLDHHPDSGFVVQTAETGRWQYQAEHVIAASGGAVEYLSEIDVETVEVDGHKFVEVDEDGRTNVEHLYAAGRVAGKPLQAAIAAGHGTEVAITLLDDVDESVARDWIVPDGYYTDRDQAVPPGVEELPTEERLERERRSMSLMREYFEEPHDEEPKLPPDVG